MNIVRRAWNRLPPNVRRDVGLRDLRQSVASSRAIAAHNARLPASAPTLNFFPERPIPRAQLLSMLAMLGVRIGSDRGGPQIAWQRGTWLNPADQAQLPDYAINRACADVSKSRVDELWTGIAGYSIAVDPLVTSGPLVEKSEENAVHDWHVVNGPLRQRKAGMVYQRLIDAIVGDVYLQSRPVIMRGHIPLHYEVHFPRQHWRADARMFPRDVGEVYSAPEIELILAFASAIGLEYGELDVLRETATGRLFVIDANPAPVRPHHITRDDEATMLPKMADAFADIFGADLAR
ncbi:MAG: hypothetical protein QOJ81_845 [Chloroflexota bacterium]|nr:hypothetical protein [Chloroflexota bacterium]